MSIGTIRSKSSAIGVVTRTASNTKNKNSTSTSKINSKSKSVSAASALKRIKYDFKAISAQVLRAKTSTSASQVVTKARSKLAQLRRQTNGSDYDEELMSAITHAAQIVRVAKKKKKHLEEEESIERKSTPGPCQCSQLEEKEDDIEDALAAQTQDISADMNEKMQEEIERQMQQLAIEAMQEEMRQRMEEFVEQMREAMEEMFEQMEDMSGLEELSDELPPALDEAMDPEDLKQLKQKHRCEEQRDIMEADMKYLKSLFQRLEREKQSGSSVSGSAGIGSGYDSYGQNDNISQNTGVFLSIGQRQIEAPMSDVVECTTEGASVDMCI